MVRQPTDYRIFISYSHLDERLVAEIEKALRQNGLTPMRDTNFAFGVGFHDQIKRFVEYAHVFMPVITRPSCVGSSLDSAETKAEIQCQRPGVSGWVHQEIGFAMAQNIPVLPVVIDCEPGQWLQTLHSVMLQKEDVNDAKQMRSLFSQSLFRNLVNRFRNTRHATYQCGFLQEDRTLMLAEYADEVGQIQSLFPTPTWKPGDVEPALSSIIRQKGALSSFHIPAEPLSDDVWTLRYGNLPKPEHHRRLQREERLALTRHAETWGAKLIIDPTLPYTNQGPGVRKVRLQSLLKYLNSKSAARTQVAMMKTPRSRTAKKGETAGTHQQSSPRASSVTIVGNWFLAESVSAVSGSGYYQTIFTRHAPSMQARIEEFDSEFDSLLDKHHWTANDSRKNAIRELKALIKNC